MTVNETRLRALYPKAPADHIKAFAASSAMAQHGLTGGANRMAFFLAQLGHESGGLTVREENLNYSAARVTQVWPSRFPTVAAAQPYAKNPKALAIKTYGGRMGNRPGTDDGWTYRGRGYIQITGRDGYEQVGRRAGINLVASPELAYQPGSAVAVAAAFWTWKNLNPVCDRDDFRQCTKIINGGYTGMADREAWLKRTRLILSSETPPVSVAVQQTKGRVATAVAGGAAGASTATVRAPKPTPEVPAQSISTPWIVGSIVLAAAVVIVLLVVHKRKQLALTWGKPAIPAQEAVS